MSRWDNRGPVTPLTAVNLMELGEAGTTHSTLVMLRFMRETMLSAGAV